MPTLYQALGDRSWPDPKSSKPHWGTRWDDIPTVGGPSGHGENLLSGAAQVSLLGKGIQGGLPIGGDLQGPPQRISQGVLSRKGAMKGIRPGWVGGEAKNLSRA